MASSSPTSSDRRRAPLGLALARALAKWADADRTYRIAVAERLRVGASDVDALILLFQDEAPWTAGKIADALALTTGAAAPTARVSRPPVPARSLQLSGPTENWNEQGRR